MYTSFFGLTEKPFTITPDPRYLFMSERHGEALAHLIYGITESDGFIQLTGEVGTGKTTLIRSMLQQLPENADLALVLNPQLSAHEFLVVICRELGVPADYEETSPRALIDALNEHLLAAHAARRRTILVVDEAQNLAVEVLEQVRLLTNLETPRQKLLQIILIGQPELRELLARNDLRQLAQRVTARYHLEPLTRDEASRYIDYRLEVAGAVNEIFTASAKREIYKLSQGVPRIMNVISDRSLLGAYVAESQQVDAKLVRQAALEISGKKAKRVEPERLLLPALGIVGAFMVVFGAWTLTRDNQRSGTASAAAPPPRAISTDVAALRDPGNSTPATEASVVRPTLGDILAQNQNRTGTATAFRTLFGLWSADYKPGASGSCAQAEKQELRCLLLRGSWNIVRQLDRPAILTLTDLNGVAHQVVLTQMDDNTAEIAIGPKRFSMLLDEISEYWFGEALLLWKPPNGEAKALRQGMRDPSVLWLRQSLATIQGVAVQDADSELFDDMLERQVRDYQRGRRLKVDGLVGQQTQIIINTDLGLDSIPRLTGHKS